MDNFSMSEKDVTGFIVLYNVVGMAAMVISSPLGGILSDKIGKRRPFVSAAGVIMAIGLFLIVIAPSTTVLIIAAGSATALGGYQTWYLFGTLVALAGGILVYRIKGVK
jgi:MFS family permease